MITDGLLDLVKRDHRRRYTRFSTDHERQGGLASSVSTACVLQNGDARNSQSSPGRSELRTHINQRQAGSAQDDYWAGRVRDDVLAYRTQQHAGKAPVAVGADHYQVGPLGHINQHLGGASF